MKKVLLHGALLLIMGLPVFAQWQGRLSPDDQQKFDSYYSRWISYRQTNNRDQERSMEDRMRDIMSHYRIPQDVPYSRIASNGDDAYRGNGGWQDRDRDRDHDRDDRMRADRSGWNLSPEDQSKFDSYYERWRQYRTRHDRDQVESMEKRMREIMARYRIPADTPFDRVASR